MRTNKRIAKRLLSAMLTVLMLMSMVTIGMASASAADASIAETGANLTGGEVLYLKPSDWTAAGARFAVYFFNNSTSNNTWASMTKTADTTATVYQVTVPTGDWAGLIFCRMNPATTENNWANKWNQSADLTWGGTSNCWGPNSNEWDGATGTWSTYTPPVAETEYNVTFNTGNFTVTGDAKVKEGEDYTFTVKAAEGYEITKVACGDAELTADANGVYTVADVKADLNITITATEIVVVTTYTVKFIDFNGDVLSSETVEEGKEAKVCANPVRDGYYFTGWSPAPEVTRTDADGTEWITVNGDLEFTAQYMEDTNDLPIITPPVVEETTKTWTVIFVDDSGMFIGYETVEDGKDATLPEAPAKAGYTFDKWDGEYTNVTDNRTITAIYTKNAVTPAPAPTHGTLRVEVAGGTGFTIAVNGGSERPQGTSYKNTKIDISSSVTVVASTTNGNAFIGWTNEIGAIVSTDESYTFTTTGNDYLKAMYQTDVENATLVLFKHDTASGGRGQILEMQYYTAGDSISFPDDPARGGWAFDGWKMTEADIQAEVANGTALVEVTPNWVLAEVYVDVVVNNGTVISYGGQNDAGQYLSYNGTTVKPDEAPENMKFAYWTDAAGKILSYDEEYKFYPVSDTEITAVFVNETETVNKTVIANVVANPAVDGTRISYMLSWDVPEECGTFVQGGFLAVETKNYNPETFVVGTSDTGNVTQGAPDAAQKAKQIGYEVFKGKSYVGTEWNVVCWVKYTDTDGNEQIVYSDMITVVKN